MCIRVERQKASKQKSDATRSTCGRAVQPITVRLATDDCRSGCLVCRIRARRVPFIISPRWFSLSFCEPDENSNHLQWGGLFIPYCSRAEQLVKISFCTDHDLSTSIPVSLTHYTGWSQRGHATPCRPGSGALRCDDECLFALSACSEFDQPRVSDVRCRRLGGYLLRLIAVRNDLASITKGVPSGMTCTQCVNCSLEGVLGRFFGGLWLCYTPREMPAVSLPL